MISPEQYREFLLPFDKRIGEVFGCIGIHNCAWNADPYLDDYAMIQNVAYIDMGLDSNLPRAKEMFPFTRRAIMYSPTDLANKQSGHIRQDIETIARDYGPCDVGLADIEAGTSDQRILEFLKICGEFEVSR